MARGLQHLTFFGKSLNETEAEARQKIFLKEKKINETSEMIVVIYFCTEAEG